jgi:hypothetical protein
MNVGMAAVAKMIQGAKNMMQSRMNIAGDLVIWKTPARPLVQPAPIAWRVKNAMRWGFLKGWIAKHVVIPFANAWGVMCAIAELRLIKTLTDGTQIDYGVVSYRVVTDAGVAYIVDDFDNAAGSADVSLFNFHGVGTGTNAENATDTALQTESTTVLTVDSTRATGTRSQPAANQFRTSGAVSFDGSAAITEHGVFTQAATGGGTLLDRSVFSAVNMVSGETLTTQYTITFTAGS